MKTYPWPLAHVFRVIDGERDYQSARWPGHKHPTGSYLTYMSYYLDIAVAHDSTTDAREMRALEPLRKFLALAVVCMEENGITWRKESGAKVPVLGPSDRQAVYDAITEERNYQDSFVAEEKYPGCDSMEISEELTLLRNYIRKADAAWSDSEGDGPALDEIRKLAAITARIFQNYGCPERVTERKRPIIGQA